MAELFQGFCSFLEVKLHRPYSNMRKMPIDIVLNEKKVSWHIYSDDSSEEGKNREKTGRKLQNADSHCAGRAIMGDFCFVF